MVKNMSKDNVDKPDEYESIFEEKHTTKENPRVEDFVEDNLVLDSSNTQSESLENAIDIDSEYKKENSDFLDSDIEDGIFAPERKVIKTSKKSSYLMLSVSLLAIIGVGGYVYYTNPSVLSKVNGNLTGNSELVLPQEPVAEILSPEILGSEEKNISVEENQQEEIVIPSVENGSDVKSDLPVEKTLLTEVKPVTEPPVEAVVDPLVESPKENLEIEPPQDLVAQPSVNLDVANTITESPELEIEKNISKEASPSDVNNVVNPSPEINNASKSTENLEVPNTAPAQEQIIQVDDVKIESDKEKAPEENIVVLNSKEEQKILDDAKLDTYFDSPNGKMLREIPAPSMDPKKGSGESIIIVNKKPISPALSKKIEIETTDLSRQTISANRALKLGRYEAAKEMYENLYNINPKDEGVLSGRALVFQKMGLKEQAINAYEELLKLYPENIDAAINLSGIIRKEYPAVALNKLLDLREKYPNNVYVIAQLGVAYSDSGNFKDAIRLLTLASEMDSQNALHFYNLAIILEKASEPKEAIKSYEKALEVDSIYGEGNRQISREKIYDRLSFLRKN